jgi:hypothetical protein
LAYHILFREMVHDSYIVVILSQFDHPFVEKREVVSYDVLLVIACLFSVEVGLDLMEVEMPTRALGLFVA